MSPEQGRGLPLDARSDLYALGVLAFEMLTGNVPYNDDNPMTVIQMHLHGAIPPMPDSIPYSVQAIVRRAMEKDASRRYQSAGEMMQHCQQVFAELNAGGVAVGAGGVPRTVIAANPQALMGQQPPQGYPPPQQSGLAPPQGGYQASAPQAKTMIAQSPFQGGVPQGGPAQPPPQQQGFVQASPMQKTIVAGMAPPILGGQMMQPGMQPQGTPGAGFPPQGAPPSSPNKTILLQPSEGVVSVARTGGAVAAAAPGMSMTGAMVQQQGASTLFWIVSLATGVAVGVIAYLIVCHL
jgi:serine/threonine-protein kinase